MARTLLRVTNVLAETALDCVCPDRQGVVCGHCDRPWRRTSFSWRTPSAHVDSVAW